MLEKDIQKNILNLLEKLQIKAWKNHNTGVYDPRKNIFRKGGMKGVSDIIGIIQGRMLCIEVKAPKGKPTLDQIEFLNMINEQGGIAIIARSELDVLTVLIQIFPTNALFLRFYRFYSEKHH